VKKKVPVVTVAEPDEAAQLAGLPLEAVVALTDVGQAVKEGLLGFCADVGLVVMRQMMDAVLTARIGPKHARIPGRGANWVSSVTTARAVVLGSRTVTVERPRGRTKQGEEVELATWAVLSSKDLLSQLVCERMLAGVATRRHRDVAEPLSSALDEKAKGTERSSVSRRLVQATEQAMAELLGRDLSGLDVAVLMVDGLEVARQCLVVALVITTDGTKVPVGLWLGDTENKREKTWKHTHCSAGAGRSRRSPGTSTVTARPSARTWPARPSPASGGRRRPTYWRPSWLTCKPASPTTVCHERKEGAM
jgi:putative transposase